MTPRTAARVAAVLLAVTAALFVVGVANEPSSDSDAITEVTTPTTARTETGEGGQGHDVAVPHTESSSATYQHTASGENPKILGVGLVAAHRRNRTDAPVPA